MASEFEMAGGLSGDFDPSTLATDDASSGFFAYKVVFDSFIHSKAV